MDAFLVPDLVLVTYRGSPFVVVLTPKDPNGDPIADLATYDEVTFSIWSGSREQPEAEVLPISLADYITFTTDPDSNPALQISIPGNIMGSLDPGQYFAELWLTPPGGEAIFTGWAHWRVENTTYQSGS